MILAERGSQPSFGAFVNAMGHFLSPVYLYPNYSRNRLNGLLDVDLYSKSVVCGAPDSIIFEKRLANF